MPSLTTENYVKAIYQIGGDDCDNVVSTGAVAQQLNISPGSVTAMLKTLRDAELVEYAPYSGVKLTASGQRLALRVLRRHRLIELFLSQTLNLSWDEVHEEAEHMEHAVSDRLVDRIDEYLGFPQTDPHGDPIPTSEGTVKSAARLTLSQWPVAQPFRLMRVLDQSSEFLRFLTESGIELAAVGVVVQHLPHAATTTISINNHSTTLSDLVASKLVVAATE